jgi:adenylate kinase
MRDIPQTLSAHEFSRAKILIIGSSGPFQGFLVDSFRSLNCYFISSDTVYRAEAERKTPLGAVCQRSLDSGLTVPNETALAIWRRWFWSSKVNKGFVLEGFPSNALQAQVLDEWLEAREQTIDIVFVIDATEAPDETDFSCKTLYDYYRNQGTLVEVVSKEALLAFLKEKSERLQFAS